MFWAEVPFCIVVFWGEISRCAVVFGTEIPVCVVGIQAEIPPGVVNIESPPVVKFTVVAGGGCVKDDISVVVLWR